jgi:hypothetical protein
MTMHAEYTASIAWETLMNDTRLDARKMQANLSLPALMLTVLLALAAPTAGAAPHPDACIEGYVWREAFPDDRVCVTPVVREQTARDNQLAGARREPHGGAYGPDTCKPGFFWREARPDDRVCVTPDVRERTARDNSLAHTRRLMPPAAANGDHPADQPAAASADPAVVPEPARLPAPAAQAQAPVKVKPFKAKKKIARKKMASKKPRFKLPEFPWPPPPYSTRLRLDRALLVAAQPTPSNGSVAARMEQALAANGYNEVSYYAVPDGFAMVTQIERIDPDAAPAAEQRWSTQVDALSLIPFSLEAYLEALFGKDGDTFRVIVFTFTPTPFTTGARPVPPGVAMAWVERGATALPAALAILPYGEDTVCTALVYEFTLSRLGGMLQRPSSFDGQQHLRAAGILGALEQQP